MLGWWLLLSDVVDVGFSLVFGEWWFGLCVAINLLLMLLDLCLRLRLVVVLLVVCKLWICLYCCVCCVLFDLFVCDLTVVLVITWFASF